MDGPTDNKFVVWTECQINDENSPLFGWDRGLVMISLKNHHGDQAICQADVSFPLTLYDLAGWFLDEIVIPIAPTLLTHSVIMLGLPGQGKTPAAMAIGKAVGFYHIDKDGKRLLMKVGVRVGQDLDFFRGAKGSKYQPDILDDPELADILISKLKAFLAVDSKGAWEHFRLHMKARSFKVGSLGLRTRMRSAQWTYWYRTQDLWAKTGEMLTKLV
jgi:hypothetical protein